MTTDYHEDKRNRYQSQIQLKTRKMDDLKGNEQQALS